MRPSGLGKWQREGAAATSTQWRTSGSRTKEHGSTSPGGRQGAEQNNRGGETWGLDKGIFVYQGLLPGASARQAKSGAKRHHNSPISVSLQELHPLTQHIFIELRSSRQWARC